MKHECELIHKALIENVNPQKAQYYPKFFKSEPGEYAEGDKFIGVTVPDQRKVAKRFYQASLETLKILLESGIHEHRLTALLILVGQMELADRDEEERLALFYLAHKNRVNNWDLVDTSAANILGKYLFHRDRSLLYDLARSEILWDKRIAIISTLYFIRQGQYEDTLKISKILLHDSHDLIHKAVGWMLREVGKKNTNVEMMFLKKHYKTMPRTMLRYAIERFPEEIRKQYLTGHI